MSVPYLFRFVTTQDKQPDSALNDRCEYDPEKDVVVVKGSRRPAVFDKGLRPLMTKKKEVEKGEDQKDIWM